MKDKSEIKTNGRAVFYSVLYEQFRKTAINHGYTLCLHGSMTNDMDMVAIPWVEDCSSVEDLVKAISDDIGNTIWKEKHTTSFEEKPHNRIAYTLSIYAEYFIDLSIMKPIRK